MQLSERETEALLRKNGFELANGFVCESFHDVWLAASRLKKPLVLKAVGPGITHKTERGLVFADVDTGFEVKNAFESLKKNAGAKASILVQEQAHGAELIIGAKRDPVFGPVVLLGLGGVQAELLRDIAIRVAPLSNKDALDLINETHVKRFTEGNGFRGKKADSEAVVGVLLKASKLISGGGEIKELDFNPVFVDGGKALVVDARVIV